MNLSLFSGVLRIHRASPFFGSVLSRISLQMRAHRACRGDADAVRSIAREYSESHDPALEEILVMALTGYAGPAVNRVFFEEALVWGDENLASFARRHGIVPLEADVRTLLLFATGQDPGSPDHGHREGHPGLSAAYHRAQVSVQRALCRAAKRRHAEAVLADALLGSGIPGAPGRLSEEEWMIVVTGLLSSSRSAELFRILPEVPVPHALIAIRSLHHAGWTPAGMASTAWDAMVRTLPENWSYPDPGTPEQAVLEMPASQTRHLLFSPDGAILATTGYDGTLLLWDVRHGGMIPLAEGCPPVSAMPVFSPDNGIVFTRHLGGTVAARELPSGAIRWSTSGAPGGDGPMAITPDGELLAVAGGTHIALVRARDGSRDTALALQTEFRITALAFSTDNRFLCGGGDNGCVAVWPLECCIPLWCGHACPGAVRDLFFTRDGAVVVVIPDRGNAVKLDAATGASIGTCPGTPGADRTYISSPCRNYLGEISTKEQVTIWEISTGFREASFRIGQKGGGRCAAVIPGGTIVVTGGEKGILRFFRPGRTDPERIFTAHKETVTALTVSPDGKTLASAGWDGTTNLWTVPEGLLLRELPVSSRTLPSSCISGDQQTIATAAGGGHVRLWQVPSGRFLRTLDAFTGQITALALDRNGGLLACAGTDGTVRLWDTRDGSMVGDLIGISGSTRALAFTPDGKEIITGGWDETLRCWSVPGISPRLTCRGHTSVITGIAVSPDGLRFVSGGTDGTVRIWDAASGDLLAVSPRDSRSVECVAVSPGGHLVAAGGRDGLVRLYRLSDGTRIAEMAGAPAAITAIAILPGDDLLVAACGDGTAGLFSIARRAHLRNFSAHADRITGIGCCDGGRLLASCGRDGTVRLWSMPVSAPPARMTPEIMDLVGRETAVNASRHVRRQWEFLHALLSLAFAHEICLFEPPHSIGEHDIGIAK